VEHVHEPGRGERLDRHAAERVLVELGDADDLEAVARGVEQVLERLGPVVAGAENDDVRAGALDQQREHLQVFVVDQADELERPVPPELRHEVGRVLLAADHEHGATPGDASVDDALPDRREEQDRARHLQLDEWREVEARPQPRGRDGNEAGQRADRRSDRRAEREQRQPGRAERAPQRDEPDRGERRRDQQRLPEGAGRGSSGARRPGAQITPKRPPAASIVAERFPTHRAPRDVVEADDRQRRDVLVNLRAQSVAPVFLLSSPAACAASCCSNAAAPRQVTACGAGSAKNRAGPV